MLIERLIKTRVQLDLLDEKFSKGDWNINQNDSRVYGGLLNALRLTARDLGLQPVTKPLDPMQVLHTHLAGRPKQTAEPA